VSDMTRGSVRRAVVLAGGAGTRLKPLTDTTPKPLVEFATEPFLTGVLRRLSAVGVTDVWVLVGADPAPFAVLEPAAQTLDIRMAIVTEPQPLGTAGGVRALTASWDEPFFVLNGDILTDVDLAAIARAHRQAHATATLVVAQVADPSAYGVCQIQDGQIVGFLEKPSHAECPGPALVNAGTYLITPALLRDFADGELSFERDVFPRAIGRGDRLHAHVSTATWADLGTPARFRAGHKLVLDGHVDWPSIGHLPEPHPGVRVAPSAQVADDARLIAPVIVAADVTVGPGAIIGPDVVLGVGVAVGPGSVLHDVVVQAASRIGTACHLTETIVGPGVTLGDRVHATDDVVIVTDVAHESVCP
jgi:mannose-1-phosphate guanylyltransferase